MYSRLSVRWYEVVRKVLCSSNVQNIEKETPLELDGLKSIISCYRESLFSVCYRFVTCLNNFFKCHPLFIFLDETHLLTAIMISDSKATIYLIEHGLFLTTH